jgi:APA family basic amino acid/polyamine antiporter
VCTILYVIVAAIMTGIVPYMKFEGVDHPVSLALQYAGQNWVAGFVDLGAILGMTTVILVMTYGQTRIIFAMSRDGLLPEALSTVHPVHATPFTATWTVGIVFAAIAAFVPLNVLAELINIGTLAAFTLISIAILVLRRTHPICGAVPLPGRARGAAAGRWLLPVPDGPSAGADLDRIPVLAGLGLMIYFAYSRRNAVLHNHGGDAEG